MVRCGWRRARDEAGSQSLELVALLPLLVALALALWQFALTGYALIVAESAVHAAAQAAAAGDDPAAAARLVAGDLTVAVDPPLYESAAPGCQVRVRLQARVPLVATSLLRGQALSLVRQATWPAAPELCP